MAESMRQGPATFAIEADQAVQAAALPAQSGASAQAAPIAPGISIGAPGVSDVGAKTFRAINDLASGLLQPKIKQAMQEQYIGGVQRAMTGEALGEIIKDQPWYTDIFAPSSALAGARTYTSQQAIAQWAGKMAEDMPKLAKGSPEELRSAAVGALQGFMTGDASADSLITSGVVEHMAPLFKQHAKEHYVYVQKLASSAQIEAWTATGATYQRLAATAASGKGTVSPEDVDAGKARLLGSIAPFADQSDDSYDRNIAHFLEASATGGNFQVIKLFKEAGLYDKITPDRKASLDRTLGVAGRKTLDQKMPDFAMDVAMLVNDMTQNPKDIPAKVLALNARAAAVTGVTEADLIPLSQLDNLIGNVMRHQAAAEVANAKAVPAPDVGVSIAESQMDLGPGALDQAVKTGLVKETDAERAGIKRWTLAATPEAKAKVLNSRTLAAFDTAKSEFVVTLRAEEFHPGVGKMAETYARLAENVKPLYFNEQDRALLDRFSAQVRAGTPPEAAWAVTRVTHAVNNYQLPENLKDEASKAIREVVENRNENFLGWNKVDEAGLRMAEAMTKKFYVADRSNNPPKVAAERSYAQARANGLDIQGKHAILNAQPKDRPLFAVVGEGEKATAEAFESLMAEKAKAIGASLDNYAAVRVPDRGGQAFIYVDVADSEGRSHQLHITSQEIKARVIKGVKTGSMLNDALQYFAPGAMRPDDKRAVKGVVTEN